MRAANPSTQPDHITLFHGQEREAMLSTNLHLSHFTSMNQLANDQITNPNATLTHLTDTHNATIANLGTTHESSY
jgi:hypothetical protein